MSHHCKRNRRSIRWKGWDYRNAGIYFLTICTHQRQNLFDSPTYYDIAAHTWQHIPQQLHAPHVTLDQ